MAARGSFGEARKVVGNALGRHGHDRPGKDQCHVKGFAIQRVAGRHVGCNIGDRDHDNKAARIVLVFIRLRMDRVVVILGVEWIDGDKPHIAPVFAAAFEPQPDVAVLSSGERPSAEHMGGIRARGSR